MKLYIEEHSWNGRVKNYQAKVRKLEYEIEMQSKNIVRKTKVTYIDNEDKHNEEEKEECSFIVTDIQDDYIVIETNRPMSCNEGGIINLKTELTVFKIEKNKKLILITPTMDYGYKYIFELK